MSRRNTLKQPTEEPKVLTTFDLGGIAARAIEGATAEARASRETEDAIEQEKMRLAEEAALLEGKKAAIKWSCTYDKARGPKGSYLLSAELEGVYDRKVIEVTGAVNPEESVAVAREKMSTSVVARWRSLNKKAVK